MILAKYVNLINPMLNIQKSRCLFNQISRSLNCLWEISAIKTLEILMFQQSDFQYFWCKHTTRMKSTVLMKSPTLIENCMYLAHSTDGGKTFQLHQDEEIHKVLMKRDNGLQKHPRNQAKVTYLFQEYLHRVYTIFSLTYTCSNFSPCH